ncbi:hypothetical protein RE9416_49060 (plasmid) [Prescottella equi]|nr:hypothetical protein RE9416_49060 [Prescottella equi]BCN61540.1 hypothetical protein RE9427_49100 [Prescottella equi]BCN86343.1 hypothetical protein RE0356_49840 [Prescottella equi]
MRLAYAGGQDGAIRLRPTSLVPPAPIRDRLNPEPNQAFTAQMTRPSTVRRARNATVSCTA